ncbi:MAG: hypothetical protein ACRDZ3_01285 [Acidimicrobiia bacterium]
MQRVRNWKPLPTALSRQSHSARDLIDGSALRSGLATTFDWFKTDGKMAYGRVVRVDDGQGSEIVIV